MSSTTRNAKGLKDRMNNDEEPISTRTRKHDVSEERGRKKGLHDDNPDEDAPKAKRARKTTASETPEAKKTSKRTRQKSPSVDSGSEHSKENVVNAGPIKVNSGKGVKRTKKADASVTEGDVGSPVTASKATKSATGRGRSKTPVRKTIKEDADSDEEVQVISPASTKSNLSVSVKSRGKTPVRKTKKDEDSDGEGEKIKSTLKSAKATTSGPKKGRGKTPVRKTAKDENSDEDEGEKVVAKSTKSTSQTVRKGRGKTPVRKIAADEESDGEDEDEKVASKSTLSVPRKSRGRTPVRRNEKQDEDLDGDNKGKKTASRSVKTASSVSKKSRGKTPVRKITEEDKDSDGKDKGATKVATKSTKSTSAVSGKSRAKTPVRKAAQDEDSSGDDGDKVVATKSTSTGSGKSRAKTPVRKTEKQDESSDEEVEEIKAASKTVKSKSAPKQAKTPARKPVKEDKNLDVEVDEKKASKTKKVKKQVTKDKLEKSVQFEDEDSVETSLSRRPVRRAALNRTYTKIGSDSEDEEGEGDVKKIKRTTSSQPKRKIVIPDSDTSDDSEFKVSDDGNSSESEDEGVASEEIEESEPESEKETPKKRGKAADKSGKKPYSRKKDVPSKASQDQSGRSTMPTAWPHLSYDFLQPENIMDENMNRPDDPDYDPKTLYIPEKFLKTATPSLKQWWEIKRKHFDCIILFKIGKFYELYHMDAVTIVNELHVSYNRANFARAGFPQIVYGRYAECLTGRGYKLVRCEQTENSDMAAERCGNDENASKVDKLVKREICQKVCKGTRVQTVLDAEITAPTSNYLLALVEKVNPQTKNPCYGVCFVDTTIGEFYLGQFEDDQCNSRLLTMIAHYPPVYVIFEKNHLSQPVSKILKTYLPEALFEPLLKEKQYWSADKVLKHLEEETYFEKDDDGIRWPEGLQPFLHEENSEIYANPDKELALNALGGCVYILKDYLIDHRLLSQSFFKNYVPLDFMDGAKTESSMPKNMILDAMTLKNLDILNGPGSLLNLLDRCSTPFGKRLLREWICKPSCRKAEIILRQMAITELAEKKNLADEIRAKLKVVVDLERLLSKMHAYGNAATVKNHPDGRALMWDVRGLKKKKVKDFEKTYNGFLDLTKIVEMFEECQSDLIKECSELQPEGSFPDLSDHLKYFTDSFDHKLALSDGIIDPKPGMDDEYDYVLAVLKEIEEESKEYLKQQKKHFGDDVKYHKVENQPFLIKVSKSDAEKADSDYELESETKGFNIYSTDKTKDLSERYIEAKSLKNGVFADLERRLFAKFSQNYSLWRKAVNNVAILDVLLSLADYTRGETTCVPKINDHISREKELFIDIRDGKHPCITNDNFIPNDTILGKTNKFFMILTGPNMGGKSTLMRQVGLIVIMSQMGCPVPADSCKLTLTDRIFTRLGARDDIVAGQSTFLVELSETASILQHATPYSLVLLDELGRGTSTYDGTAIASAVVHALLRKKCRTLFSTHYHSLIEDFASNQNVILAHMACTTKSEKGNPEEDEENVAFLYKLSEGACPKSYGFNAARLAGIPQDVIQKARSIATGLEREVKLRHVFRSICQSCDDILPEQVEVLLKNL